MKKVKALLVTSLASLAVSAAANANTVTVNIDKIGSNDGNIYIRLYSDAEKDGFPKEEAVLQTSVQANTAGASVTFENVASGKYAISMFQDENSNGKIDTNMIGIPKEPVGYSGEKQMLKPGYDGASFDISGDMEVTATFH